MEALRTFFKTNITDEDHSIYKVFIAHLREKGTSIVQKGLDSYILINEEKGRVMTVGGKVMEIIGNDNVIMVCAHEHIREKMIERIKEEIEDKTNKVMETVNIYRNNNIKKLL